jgi:hypothetical protein
MFISRTINGSPGRVFQHTVVIRNRGGADPCLDALRADVTGLFAEETYYSHF